MILDPKSEKVNGSQMQKYLKYTLVPLAKITATIFHFMKHCQPTCFSKKCIHNALNKDQGESIHKFLFVFAIRCSCSVREYNTYIELGHENKRTKPWTGYPQTSRNILGLTTKELISLGSQFNKNILRNFKPQFQLGSQPLNIGIKLRTIIVKRLKNTDIGSCDWENLRRRNTALVLWWVNGDEIPRN